MNGLSTQNSSIPELCDMPGKQFRLSYKQNKNNKRKKKKLLRLIFIKIYCKSKYISI